MFAYTCLHCLSLYNYISSVVVVACLVCVVVVVCLVVVVCVCFCSSCLLCI